MGKVGQLCHFANPPRRAGCGGRRPASRVALSAPVCYTAVDKPNTRRVCRIMKTFCKTVAVLAVLAGICLLLVNWLNRENAPHYITIYGNPRKRGR